MQPFHADCTSQPVFSFIFLQVPCHAISTNPKHYQGFKISFSVIFWSTKNFPRKISARVTYITTGWSSNVLENISYKNIATWRNSKSDKIFLLKNHLSLKNLHFLTYINLTQNSKPLNYSKVSLLNSKLVKKVFINIYFLSEFRIQ